MSARTIIFVCVSGAAVLVIGFGCLGLWAMRFLEPFSMQMPPELEQASVLNGKEFLQQRVFVAEPSIGQVTDIIFDQTAELTIGIAGVQGAVWVTPDGVVTSTVAIPSFPTHVDFVDVDGDGVFEFLNRGGSGWQEASLIDSTGKVLWTCDRKSGVDDMAAGDLDGDGIAEFVVGYNGGEGVHLLDRDGHPKWKQPDANVWHVEIVDADGDGRPEIVHSNAGGQITVRDATGKVLRRSSPEAYFSDFSVCRWPTNDDPHRLLAAEDDQIWLFDFDGTTIARLDAPNSGTSGEARGTLVRFEKDQPPYLVVVANFYMWNRAVLYVFNDARLLVYQEILGEACASLAALPGKDAETEVLLIGGRGKVWEYTRTQ